MELNERLTFQADPNTKQPTEIAPIDGNTDRVSLAAHSWRP